MSDANLLSHIEVQVLKNRPAGRSKASVGPGPCRELVENWKARFPAPATCAAREKKVAAARPAEDVENEEGENS